MSTPFAYALAAIVALSLLGLPIGHAMIAGSILYLYTKGLDLGTAAEQLLNGMNSSFVLLAIPLFILPYQLSRLVDRMEKDGLVKRIACKEDKRGHLLEPTPKGFALRKAMWTVYAPAMDDALNRINDKEALELARLLNKLGGIEHVDCGDKG